MFRTRKPEPPNYFATYVLNYVLGYASPDDARPLEASFLRNWTIAVREYRSGREHLAKIDFDFPRTSYHVGLFLTALAHFESCAINADLALQSVRGMNGLKRGAKYQLPFGKFAERLRGIYNEV
jgi:hypothetical protein